MHDECRAKGDMYDPDRKKTIKRMHMQKKMGWIPKRCPWTPLAAGWVGACMGALVGGRRHRWSATRFSECPCGGITYFYYQVGSYNLNESQACKYASIIRSLSDLRRSCPSCGLCVQHVANARQTASMIKPQRRIYDLA